MNWSANWAQPTDRRDAMSQDELLVMHESLKNRLTALKDEELELRKYIVNRAFPEKVEGVNNLPLGNGYTLKAKIAYNYNLADNDTVERTLDKIAKVGNQGQFIVDRLISWTPHFLLTEYRALTEAAPHSQDAQEILSLIGEMLTVTEAAPTLDIKAPKVKK